MKHNLSVFHIEASIDRAKLQHVEQFSSNSTSSSIIVLLGLYSLSADMLSTCLLSDLFK